MSSLRRFLSFPKVLLSLEPLSPSLTAKGFWAAESLRSCIKSIGVLCVLPLQVTGQHFFFLSSACIQNPQLAQHAPFDYGKSFSTFRILLRYDESSAGCDCKVK